MNRSPGAQRQDSQGHRLSPKRKYSRLGTAHFLPVPSPFQWNWLLAYTSPSVRKSVLYSRYRMREFESSSSGSVVTTTRGFWMSGAAVARRGSLVVLGALVAHAPS